MTDQVCIFTRGMSGSGKSTFARAWVAEDPANRARINMDDIRSTLALPYSRENEALALRVQDRAFVAVIQSGRSVVVDNTHLHPAWPRRLAALARKFDVPLQYQIQDFLDVPFTICCSRDILRGENSVGNAVILRQLALTQRQDCRWTIDDLD